MSQALAVSIDEAGDQVTPTAVHPDGASLELLMEVDEGVLQAEREPRDVPDRQRCSRR